MADCCGTAIAALKEGDVQRALELPIEPDLSKWLALYGAPIQHDSRASEAVSP